MAVHFSGSNGSTHTSIYNDNIFVAGFPFTWAIWCKPETFSTTKRLWSMHDTPFGGSEPGDRYTLSLSGGSTFSVEAGSKDFVFTESVNTASSGVFDTWNHAAGVFESSGYTAYLNGVASTKHTTVQNVFGNPLDRTSIGGHPTASSSYGFAGCLALATMWDVALSGAEIAQLASGVDPLTIQPDRIVVHRPLDTVAAVTDGPIGGSWTLELAPTLSWPNGVDQCVDDPDLPDPFETGVPDECGEEDEADALQTAITWSQCELVPGSISVDVVAPSVSPGRSFSGIEQLVQPEAGYWRITYHDVPIRTRADVLRWREIEGALEGRNGVILIPVYEAKLSSEAIAASAAEDYEIGETRIGIVQTAGSVLPAGIHFSHGGRLYRITRIHSQETGETYDVSIYPPLRAAIAADDSLDFNTPECRCRLERDDSMDLNLELLRFSRPSVTFVEDV